MNTDAAMTVNCNVTVRCIDRHGQVTQELHKHNKATYSMVEGLLKFLGGNFNNTVLKEGTQSFPEEAIPYIPVRAEFGRVGVKLVDDDTLKKRYFDFLDSSEFAKPTFISESLQEPISFQNYTILNFSKVRTSVFIDPNNSQCLKMSLYIDPGKLVGYPDSEKGFVPYEWSYWNPTKNEYEAMFTEAGLFSSTGNLLARVLFDGEVQTETAYDEEGNPAGTYPSFVRPSNQMNPIIQTQTSTIVVEWRIGLVSVGDNDELITQNNLTTPQFVTNFVEWFMNEIVPAPGLTESEIKGKVTDKVNSLLSNNDTSVVEVSTGN